MGMLESWVLECKSFKGDSTLFWAGKMSIVIGYMEHINPIDYSTYFSLLLKVKEKYDHEILNKGLKPLFIK